MSSRNNPALVVIVSCVLCHIYKMYLVGARGDEWLECYQANFTSLCFVLAVSIFLAQGVAWPSVLKCPPATVLYAYLILLSTFTVSLSLRLIWLPLTMNITKSNVWLATQIKNFPCFKSKFMIKLANFLESGLLQNIEVTGTAVFFLAFALKASGIYDEIKAMPKQQINCRSIGLKRSRSRVGDSCADSYLSDLANDFADEDIVGEGTSFFREMVNNVGFRDVINRYLSSYL